MSPQQQAASTGLSLAGQVFFGSLSAGTFALGVWQTDRYFEKTNLVQQRQHALQQPPLTHFVMGHNKAENFRRMQIRGTYLYDHEVLVGPRGPPLGALPNKPGYAAGGMAPAPQGYYVLTPLVLATTETTTTNAVAGGQKGKGGSSDVDNENGADKFVVWVNRGWVPLVMVDGQTGRRGGVGARRNEGVATNSPLSIAWERPQETKQSAANSNNANNNNSINLWKKKQPPPPEPSQLLSTVTVVSSTPEQPRFLVAGHKLEAQPLPKLFWFDMTTLRNLLAPASASAAHDNHADDSTRNSALLPSSSPSTYRVLGLVTAVHDKQSQSGCDSDSKINKNKLTFPLTPSAQDVGDFKTPPQTHAGYAVTWYGLAVAGAYMTRKLMLKR